MNSDKTSKYMIITIILLSMAVIGVTVYFTSPAWRKSHGYETVKTDTIFSRDTIWKSSDTVFVEVFKEKPVPVPVPVPADTQWMPCVDSVPITQQQFSNDVLDLWVSGYNVSVDSMKYRETHIHDTIIIKETTQIETIKIKKFRASCEIGAAYLPFNDNKVGPYLDCDARYVFKNKIGIGGGLGLFADIPDKKIIPYIRAGISYNF